MSKLATSELVALSKASAPSLPRAADANSLFQAHLPCESAQLRRVYLRLALRYHPDKWPLCQRSEATELFQAIGATYEELCGGPRNRAQRVKDPTAAAAELGDVDELRELLKERRERASEPDASGVVPLMCAARGGSVAAALLLLEHGASLESRTILGWSVLLFGALSDAPERESMVRWLVARGCAVTQHELSLAAYTGNAKSLAVLTELFVGDVVSMLTGNGDHEGGPGKTLLHLVCEGLCHLRKSPPEDYLKCAQFLLRLGIPVNATEPIHGRTCLQSFVYPAWEWHDQKLEASEPHLELLEMLCQAGADVEQRDMSGHSAISLAAAAGLVKVQALLSSRATADLTSRM